MPFDAEQNEIEYEDAMIAQADAVTTGAVARAELDWANRKIDQLRTDLATANATIASLQRQVDEAESKTTLCYACNAEVEKLAFRLAEIETENSNG